MKKYNVPSLGKFKRVANYQWMPNQFIIEFAEGEVFQSYDSIIVVKIEWEIFIGQDYDYSRTTWKYRNYYLWEWVSETRKKIDSWEYKMLRV